MDYANRMICWPPGFGFRNVRRAGETSAGSRAYAGRAGIVLEAHGAAVADRRPISSQIHAGG